MKNKAIMSVILSVLLISLSLTTLVMTDTECPMTQPIKNC